MADETHSQLHQGAILEGAGGNQSSWLDPEPINILADPKPLPTARRLARSKTLVAKRSTTAIWGRPSGSSRQRRRRV